ncbi:uncharacterized protein QC761_116995 [Podospora bellae-mahoneyi]|uniref:Uncharacterized protein n=2 Tax=Podospora TaxID=5144 RepID=A0ABY6RYG3_PODCO|nr:hypothetical protein QC761_116995 [Podospora bellae-mahoneyi]VBB73244.1 Putative protein of unknown function [Podospora comata]
MLLSIFTIHTVDLTLESKISQMGILNTSCGQDAMNTHSWTYDRADPTADNR